MGSGFFVLLLKQLLRSVGDQHFGNKQHVGSHVHFLRDSGNKKRVEISPIPLPFIYPWEKNRAV